MNTKEERMRDRIEELMTTRRFTDARRACDQLMERFVANKGKRHQDIAVVHELRGKLFMRMERPRDAVVQLQKAVTVLEAAGCEWETWTADILMLLASAQRAAGAEDAAVLGTVFRAAGIRKALLSPDDAGIAEVIARVFSIHKARENDPDVTATGHASVAIWTAEHLYGTGYLACMAIEGLVQSKELEVPDDGDPDVAPSPAVALKRDIAVVLCRWLVGRYASLLGPRNERQLVLLEQLAELYEARGDTDQAVVELQRAMSIKERMPSRILADRIQHLDTLDRLYEKAGDRPKQIAVLKKLLAVQEEDPELAYDDQIAKTADRLGTACLAADNFTEAFAWFKRAAAFRPAEEADREDAILYRFHLGNAYEAHGKDGAPGSCRRALGVYRETLRLARQWLGPKDAMVAHILNAMGNVFWVLKSYGEAARCLREALTIRKATAGADDVLVAESLNDLALVHLMTGKFHEARRLLRRALAIVEQEYGVNHADIGFVVNNLGLACAGCKDYRHAIEHLERVMRILEDSFGNTDVNLVPQLQNLGDVFAMAGRKKDAEGAYRRALMIAGGRRRPDPEETKELQARITQLAANTRPRSAGNLWVLPSGAQWQVDDAEKDTAIVPSKS